MSSGALWSGRSTGAVGSCLELLLTHALGEREREGGKREGGGREREGGERERTTHSVLFSVLWMFQPEKRKLMTKDS